MINWIRKGTVEIPRLHSIYRGRVTKNNDPEKRGRLKLIVPAVLGQAETTWAAPKNLSTGVNAGNFDIPSVGAPVWVQFEDGNPSLPIWEAGSPIAPPGSQGPQIPPEALEDYPNTKVYATPSGHKIVYRSGQNAQSLTILSPSGHSVTLDDTNQKVTVHSNGGHSIALDDRNKDIDIASTGGHKVNLNDATDVVSVKTAGGPALTLDQTASNATLAGGSVGLGDVYSNLSAARAAITQGDLNAYNNSMTSLLLNMFVKYTNLITSGGAFNNDGGNPGSVLAALVSGWITSFTLPNGSATTRIK